MISAMKSTNKSPRIQLIRETAILQLKLFADGFRDAVLIPVSLLAALLGLIRGGEDCDREFRRVIKIGRRTERWINLFGHQRPLGSSHPAGSMDKILGQVEAVVIDQYKKGRSTAETREAVSKALDKDSQKKDDTKP
jgi:hypothetical protein